MRRGLAILVAFVGASNAASGLPPRQPPPTAGARGGGAPNSEDIELLARVVEARLSSTDLLLPLTEEELLEGNATHSIGKMQKRMLLRTTAWLKKQNPALWLLLATVLETGEGAKRLEKRSEMEVLRSLGEDYHVTIVTTAALPWMTGTAVNPLLRAAHLAKAGKRVTLAVPWLHPIEQQIVFPPNVRFDSPAEQEAYTRRWLRERAGLRSADFTLTFYASRYDSERGSILPIGDITRFIDPAESDICVLEEPEHLSWYHNGHNWRHRFKLVVGVVHTNYLFYARTYDKGTIQTEALKAINQVMCHAYCDKVIKLSDTLQPLPRAVVCNVHGVRADFLDAGKRASRRKWKRGAYSIGKVLWAKGHRELLDYLQLQRERGEPPTHVDVYGKGEDLEAVQAEARTRELDVAFHGPVDHAGAQLRSYKVFVNPSQSEVLSTTTAEALAMGKYAVIQRHPSNDFFMQFRNALPYDTPSEFLLQLRYALATEPAPLSDAERRALSWEGATERFLDAVINTSVGDTLPTLGDHTAGWLHQGMQKGKLADAIRELSGAGPVSRQSWLPKHLEEQPSATAAEIVEMSVQHSPPIAESAAPPA